MTPTRAVRPCAAGASPHVSGDASGPTGSGLGRLRWVVEAAVAWLHGPRKLRIRWEIRDDIHDAFLQLAHCMILARKLPSF